jgi:hypothetical protein
METETGTSSIHWPQFSLDAQGLEMFRRTGVSLDSRARDQRRELAKRSGHSRAPRPRVT